MNRQPRLAPRPDRENLRVVEGRFVLTRVTDIRSVAIDVDLLALVLGPDGGASMRRDRTAGQAPEDAWSALWNGDDAHEPDATGMLSAVVSPLAAADLPLWTAASYDGDLVLVPVSRLDEAVQVLRQAGHHVSRPVDPEPSDTSEAGPVGRKSHG